MFTGIGRIASSFEGRSHRFGDNAGIGMISEPCHACSGRTIRTAEDRFIKLHSVPQYPTATMFAGGCQYVDCAFEAIELIRMVFGYDAKRILIVIAAAFTFGHDFLLEALHF